MAVRFFCHNIHFSLHGSAAVKRWLSGCMRSECCKAGGVHFVFCDDRYLLSLNRRYLHHSYLTDVITFDYPVDRDIYPDQHLHPIQPGKKIHGEIYISIDRVRKNAVRFKTTFRQELLRVMVHGTLHLCGYKDKAIKEKRRMTAREDYYLKRYATYYLKRCS